MCRKLICQVFIGLLMSLILISAASADFIGWWKFDEGSGTIAADSSGKGHDGTINGGAAWAAGKFGGALQFDGTDDYVLCGLININTAVSGGMTVCAWINKPAGGDMKFCSNRRVAEDAGGGFTCAIYNNRLEMDFTSATSRNLNRDTDGPIIPANTWVHVAWVYDDVANTFSEYHDGVLADSSTENVSISVSAAAFRIGANSPTLDHYFNGLIDDLRIYNNALSEVEIQQAMLGWGPMSVIASKPFPDKQGDVQRDVILSWTPGDFADKHNVYLGTVLEDVNTVNEDDLTGVLVSKRQDPNTYPAVLEFSGTYYWRVDEVNAPPNTNVIYRGNVWSFTVEPFAYPIEDINATASGLPTPNMGPEKTIDGSGLNADDGHSSSATDMWLSGIAGTEPMWIKYKFDSIYKLHQMWVWNYNSFLEPSVGWGLKNVTVEYSTDDSDWKRLENVPDFNQAAGLDNYMYNTTVDFNGIVAQYIRITANSNWKGISSRYGLSEVRFFYIPVIARLPQPGSGSAGVPLDATLSWRAGRDAAAHQVYFSGNRNAVESNTALVGTVSQSSYPLSPLGLELGKTYYWKINEVNEADINPSWEGEVWSFTAAEYLTVDDFEKYDITCNRLYYVWEDGVGHDADAACGVAKYDGNKTGSTVGSFNAPFVETTIVRSGSTQSMPLEYNNTLPPYYSEAQRQWTVAQDWTKGGAKQMSLWFYGGMTNSAQSLYVALQNVTGAPKVVVHDNPAAIQTADWQEWKIDLTKFTGVDLSGIKRMYIGVGNRTTPAAGGMGKLYIDDIRLYP